MDPYEIITTLQNDRYIVRGIDKYAHQMLYFSTFIKPKFIDLLHIWTFTQKYMKLLLIVLIVR